MIKDLQLLLAGGTIDSEWDPTQDTAVPFAHSNIKPFILKFIQPDFEIYEKTITMLDSRDIDENIREVIFKNIKTAKSDNIIIPHGTYTIAQTGQFLKDKIAREGGADIKNKRIVLVGSFYPLVGFSQSDAPYNLGFAIGSIEHLPAGVWVAMNSRIFDPSSVSKNIVKGKFFETK
jgi:L-asparaginase